MLNRQLYFPLSTLFNSSLFMLHKQLLTHVYISIYIDIYIKGKSGVHQIISLNNRQIFVTRSEYT